MMYHKPRLQYKIKIAIKIASIFPILITFMISTVTNYMKSKSDSLAFTSSNVFQLAPIET